MKEIDLILKLKNKVKFASRNLEDQERYKKRDSIQGNFVEMDCVDLVSEKIKHNIQQYSLAIKALENVKSTYLTNEEIDQIREKHERNLH